MPRKRPVPDNLKELYALHSIPELRKMFSCGQITLLRWLDEAGVKRRTAGGRGLRVDNTIQVSKLSTGETDMKMLQGAPRNQPRRVSSDGAWPLRGIDGKTFAERRIEREQRDRTNGRR